MTVRDNTSPENPREYYRPAGNITAGGRELSLTVLKPLHGDIPGWREYYRPLGDTSGRWGYSRPLAGAFPAGAGYSRPVGWIFPLFLTWIIVLSL